MQRKAMSENETDAGASDELRQRAEERLQSAHSQGQEALLPEQAQRVLHELRVHQIQLEMQNEELRRAHAELEASRERYFDLYNLAPIGYLTLSETGTILQANLTAAQLLGVERSKLVQKPLAHFIRPKDRGVCSAHLKKLFETGTPQVCVLRMKKKEGDLFWARIEASASFSGGDLSISRAAMSDITAEKQMEEQLSRAKEFAEAANRAKDQFLAILSHELRTPLTPALAILEMLEADGDLPASLLRDLELIHRNVKMETALIDDLLDTTKINYGKIDLRPEVVDMQDCLETALGTCQQDISAKRLATSIVFQAERHHVWADTARMRQVFWNLIRNAVKFTPEEGQIALRTRNAGDRLQIEVVDTGIGIEAEALPRIFNRFEQGERSKIRQFGGLGLGLHIARAIVEMHQGRLTVFSAGKNKGATFTVELADVPPAEKAVAPAPFVEAAERPLRILMVEDHPDTSQVLVRLLKSWGHAVTAAVSFQKAQELVAQREFDLLISDLGLPDGSGLELMRQAKERAGIPGIALSGYGAEEDVRQSKAAGFAEHLVKPVNLAALRTLIRQIASAGL